MRETNRTPSRTSSGASREDNYEEKSRDSNGNNAQVENSEGNTEGKSNAQVENSEGNT